MNKNCKICGSFEELKLQFAFGKCFSYFDGLKVLRISYLKCNCIAQCQTSVDKYLTWGRGVSSLIKRKNICKNILKTFLMIFLTRNYDLQNDSQNLAFLFE